MKEANSRGMLSRQDVSSMQKESGFRWFVAPPLEILVVDDDGEVRDAAARTLHTAGYRTLTAPGGDAAQKLLGDVPPALVLTDLWMPHGNGWDLLLHCQKRWPLMPVLLMSSTPPGLHPDIECWAAGFIMKPFSSAKLLSEVGRLAARRILTQKLNPADFITGEPAG